jgi:hypothetical protein
LLVGGGFGVSAGTESEHGDEQRRRTDLAGGGIVNRQAVAGPVDKHLLSGRVFLPQHYVAATADLAIAEAQLESQAEHFVDFAHGYPFSGQI